MYQWQIRVADWITTIGPRFKLNSHCIWKMLRHLEAHQMCEITGKLEPDDRLEHLTVLGCSCGRVFWIHPQLEYLRKDAEALFAKLMKMTEDELKKGWNVKEYYPPGEAD